MCQLHHRKHWGTLGASPITHLLCSFKSHVDGKDVQVMQKPNYFEDQAPPCGHLTELKCPCSSCELSIQTFLTETQKQNTTNFIGFALKTDKGKNQPNLSRKDSVFLDCTWHLKASKRNRDLRRTSKNNNCKETLSHHLLRNLIIKETTWSCASGFCNRL